jgi:RND family efflux transporter MFP subunit
MNRSLKLSLTLPVLLTAMMAQAQAPDGPPPALVEVESAVSNEVAATTWVSGTVVSRNDARIAAEITGRATWVAEVGTAVAAGDAIATIEDRDLQLELQNSATIIKRLEAQLRYQRSQVKRLQQLAQSSNAAANELDEARANTEMAEQDLVAAGIARERIQYSIERSRVKAPFPGRIAERLIQPGEFVNSGNAVARLVDTQHKEVRAQAPLSNARFITEGDIVDVEDEFQQARNPIRTVVPVGDERSRMIEIRVHLEQSDWVIGSAVRVALPTSQSRLLVAVPRDALVLRGDETFVYKIAADDSAERVDVRTGIGLGHRVEVIGDIKAGDQLIIRGGERLQPGQAVTITDRESNTGP